MKHNPRTVVLESGAIVYIGRDAAQNDYLCTKYKNNVDALWFHIKDSPGPHVILINSIGLTDVQIAAGLAIHLSKKDHGIVEYCTLDQVYKKRGAKLGEVCLTDETKEIIVTRASTNIKSKITI